MPYYWGHDNEQGKDPLEGLGRPMTSARARKSKGDLQ